MKEVFKKEHIALQVTAESKSEFATHQEVSESDYKENDQEHRDHQ
jgi:hypothetical protein